MCSLEKKVAENNPELCQNEIKAEEGVIPSCPNCKSNERVVKNDEQHVMTQLFIAKPLDDFFCLECSIGFSAK